MSDEDDGLSVVRNEDGEKPYLKVDKKTKKTALNIYIVFSTILVLAAFIATHTHYTQN